MAAYLKQHGMRSLIYNADSCPTGLTKRAEIAERWQMDETKPDTVDEAIAMEFVAVLDKLRPKVVGFTSKVVDIKITLQLAEIAKAAYPKIKVLIGGVSASTCTAYLLRNHQVDYLVMGEGEQTIVELTAALLGRPDAPAPETVAGIAYRDRATGCIRRTAARPLIENLDELPFPEREAMFVVKDGALVRAVEAGDIIVSRGCPYHCKFCAAYVNWGTHRPRFRSNENVVAELKHLAERYGQRRFIFWDDLFTSNRARIMDLCARILAAGLEIRWICLARINTIDAELLEQMKAAGCVEVQLGIESGNDRILQHINKGITLQMILYKKHRDMSFGLQMYRQIDALKNNMEEIVELTGKIAATTQDGTLYEARAAAWARMWKFSQAIDDYSQAEKRGVRSAALYWKRGKCYWELTDFPSFIVYDLSETAQEELRAHAHADFERAGGRLVILTAQRKRRRQVSILIVPTRAFCKDTMGRQRTI